MTRENFAKYITLGDLRRAVYENMEKSLTDINLYEHEWDFSELYKLDHKVNIKTIEALFKLLIDDKAVPSKEEYIKYFTRCYMAKNYDELAKPANKNLDTSAVTGIIAKTLIEEV